MEWSHTRERGCHCRAPWIYAKGDTWLTAVVELLAVASLLVLMCLSYPFPFLFRVDEVVHFVRDSISEQCGGVVLGIDRGSS